MKELEDLINRYSEILELVEKRCQVNEAMCDLFRKRIDIYETALSDMMKLIKSTETPDLINNGIRIAKHLVDLDQTYIQMGKSYLEKVEKETLDEED